MVTVWPGFPAYVNESRIRSGKEEGTFPVVPRLWGDGVREIVFSIFVDWMPGGTVRTDMKLAKESSAVGINQ